MPAETHTWDDVLTELRAARKDVQKLATKKDFAIAGTLTALALIFGTTLAVASDYESKAGVPAKYELGIK